MPTAAAEVAQSGLAGVSLPVGVGGEACRRVESQMPAHIAGPLGIHWEKFLEAQDKPQHKQAEHAEHRRADRVFLPVHILVLIDFQQPVNPPLRRAQDSGEKYPFPVHHLCNVISQRDCQQNQYDTISDHLNSHIRHCLSPLNRIIIRYRSIPTAAAPTRPYMIAIAFSSSFYDKLC